MTAATTWIWQTVLEPQTAAQFKHYGKLEDHTDGVAGRALGAMLIKSGAVHRRVYETDMNHPRGPGCTIVEHTALVVRDPRDIEAAHRELRLAKAQGMYEASNIARAAAAKYDGLQGMCGGVIASSLRGLADRLNEEAQRFVEDSRPTLAPAGDR